MTTPPDLMTIEEVADLLRTPVNTLRYWRHKGVGPRAAKMGSTLRYRRADVVAWVDAQFAEAPGEHLEAAGQ